MSDLNVLVATVDDCIPCHCYHWHIITEKCCWFFVIL